MSSNCGDGNDAKNEVNAQMETLQRRTNLRENGIECGAGENGDVKILEKHRG
jgi:hypothetical protein